VQPAIMTLGSTLGSRVVIIGNSGSGKSTLADALARRIGAPAIDLDLFHWQDSYGIKRDEDAAKRMVADAAAGSKWIIEGVYGWLAEVALLRATSLIWLDMPWSICSEGLSARGLRRDMTQDDHVALLGWAEAYWQRTTPSSFTGHLALFENFAKTKIRIERRSEIDAFLADLRRNGRAKLD
jgi:adenylate kinase family enzyme